MTEANKEVLNVSCMASIKQWVIQARPIHNNNNNNSNNNNNNNNMSWK